MDSNAEREQLLINSPSKPSSVKCDIANECQMFLNAEEGGGDAHTNMNQSATNDTGKSNLFYPSFYPTKVFSPGDIIDDSNPEHVVEANEIQNESTSKAQETDNYSLSTQNESTSKSQESDDSLPSTVTILDAPDGGKVYLVGTAHFSLESQEDVSKVIQKVCPHMVMVELCEQRTNILLLDEDVILSEAKNINIAKIRASIAQNGVFNGLMYILLLNMTAHLTTELGMAPGGEFRRAMAEAKKIPNCIVQLGDRSINITLQRAISALSWGQTIRFIWHLLTSNQNISLEEVERCKQKKLLEDMLEEMAEEFPALKHVFVVERDMYLCHSLQIAAMQPRREPCRIVGVVGIGHVAGIVEHWGKMELQDISPLLQIPPPSLSTRALRVSARAAAAGALLYALYRLLPRRWLF